MRNFVTKSATVRLYRRMTLLYGMIYKKKTDYHSTNIVNTLQYVYLCIYMHACIEYSFIK